MDELLSELKSLEQSTAIEFKRALMAMRNLDDAAVLNVSIGQYSYTLPLAIVDLYWGFVQFLEDSVEALEAAD